MEYIGKEVYVKNATNKWRFAVIIKVQGCNYTVRYKDDVSGMAEVVHVRDLFPLFIHATNILNHFDRVDIISSDEISAEKSAVVITPVISPSPIRKSNYKEKQPRYAEIVLKMNEEMLKLKRKVDRIVRDLDDEKEHEFDFDALEKICSDADALGKRGRSPSFSSMFSSSNFSYYEEEVKKKPVVIKKPKIIVHEDDCHICNDGGSLICCDNCPLVYHLHCAKLKEAPDGDWICMECQRGVKKQLEIEL